MKKYLIVGCGERQVKRFKECVALDIDLKNLIKSKKLKPNNNYIQADANFLPFKKELFDNVIYTEVLEHLRTPKDALLEMNRVLKPNGKSVLSVPLLCEYFAKIFPAYKRDFFNGYHPSEFTQESFFELINETNFKIIKTKRTKTEFYFWRLWAYLTKVLDLDVFIEETGKLKLNTQNKFKNILFNLSSKGIRIISFLLGIIHPIYTGIKVEVEK